MKKITFSAAFLLIAAISFSKECKKTKHLHSKNQKFSGGCYCSTSFNYGGYTFSYSIAYYTSNGTCDPCYSVDSYAAFQDSNGSIIAEGVPSEFGFGFACGSDMRCITKAESKKVKYTNQI